MLTTFFATWRGSGEATNAVSEGRLNVWLKILIGN